jgi:dienelactone hydrolase
MAIHQETVSYREGKDSLTGVCFSDDTWTGKRPGVMVIHGGAGLDAHARAQASRFAREGYLAFACDMYGEGVSGDRQRVMERLSGLRGDREWLCRRAGAGLTQLKEHPRADGRAVVVGYCFGGLAALELARSGTPLDGVVSVHGGLATSRPAEPEAIRAKVLVCHGALDPHSPVAHVSAFIEEMNRAGADWQLALYGGAMHGFTHEAEVASTRPGVAYHAPTDARSWEAIRRFLGELFAAA